MTLRLLSLAIERKVSDNIMVSHSDNPRISDIASRTRWSVLLHWYMLSALSISALFSIVIAEGLSQRFYDNAIFLLIIFLSNSIFYFLSRLQRGELFYRGIVIGIVFYELILITAAMYLNGGLESQIFILYVVPILISTVLISSAWVYITAITAVILASAYMYADYQGIITSLNTITGLNKNYEYVLSNVVYVGLVTLLIAYLANYMIMLLRQKERQVQEHLDALTRAQELGKMGSWEWDIENDTVTWSEQMYKMFGIRSGSAIDYSEYVKRLHPDDRQVVTRTISRSLKSGRPYRVMHKVHSRGDKIITILGEGKVIKNAGGKPIKVIGTSRDVTAEQELEQAKSNFVSLASHQLRTPATEVRMLLSLLMDGYAGELTPQQRDIIEKAHQTNERQMKIANDLLGIAQLNTGRFKLKKSKIELGKWLAAIADDIRPMLTDKDQQFVFTPIKKNVSVRADDERLQLVIENLIENASKYTPDGGKVTLSYSATKTHAIIKVADTGIGIAPADHERIFDIYSRANHEHSPHVSGSGLGLYLVKRLVDLHRGKITVSSKPKAGSTFTIQLPL